VQGHYGDDIRREGSNGSAMSILGVADPNPKPLGFRYAQEKGIYTTKDYRELYKIENLNMIIDRTGRDEIATEISHTKPDRI
jgi:hypothetical protein